MNHTEKLLEIYNESFLISDINDLTPEIIYCLKIIGRNCYKQKGVYTVLVTLLTHKLLVPSQDIRYHQKQLTNGFSARVVDTQYITPTLKRLKLPAMAESGWLTRSLEQPHPYTFDYPGNIGSAEVKTSFLLILDYVESNPGKSLNILRILLNEVSTIVANRNISIIPLTSPELLQINTIISMLDEHFHHHYNVQGASKLPVLAFYSIYMQLISELDRYSGCTLAELGSHTASDRTSRKSGDIEIFKDAELFESIEIKLGREIDYTTVLISIEKIFKFNPQRYYIFSDVNVSSEQMEDIFEKIAEVKNQHGCQIIINGITPTLKYYLRLVNSTEEFIINYSNLISDDDEIMQSHIEKWNEIIKRVNLQ